MDRTRTTTDELTRRMGTRRVYEARSAANLLAVAASLALLAAPAAAQQTSDPNYILEVFEPTGENLFARNIYACPLCTPEQLETLMLPPGFEADASSRAMLPEVELGPPIPPPGVSPSLDLSLELPGDDFFYVARVLDGSILDAGTLSILAEVERDTTFTYTAGTRVHEVADPDGYLYILFALELTSGLDPTQPDALSGIGLPPDWTISDRVLTDDLVVDSGGLATVFTPGAVGNFQRYALVPEPGTATLVGVGLVVVAARRPRRGLPAPPEAPASCALRQPCRLGAS